MNIQKFLCTPLGSIVKVALTVVIAHITLELESGKSFKEIFNNNTLWSYATVIGASVLPMISNYINRYDTRYGKKPKSPNFPIEDSKKIKP